MTDPSTHLDITPTPDETSEETQVLNMHGQVVKKFIINERNGTKRDVEAVDKFITEISKDIPKGLKAAINHQHLARSYFSGIISAIGTTGEQKEEDLEKFNKVKSSVIFFKHALFAKFNLGNES